MPEYKERQNLKQVEVTSIFIEKYSLSINYSSWIVQGGNISQKKFNMRTLLYIKEELIRLQYFKNVKQTW